MRIFIVCLITALQGRAQTAFKSVKLEPSSIMAMIYGQSEPSIAIDPKNPNIIAAGAILNEYYYSMDGGETWKSTKLKSKYGVWGDPVLMFDTTGKFYYFHLANYKKTSWIDRIVCQSSNSVDGKFNQGTFPKPNGTKAQDKHWTVLDPATNTIYMTWTQFDAYDSKDPKDRSIIVFSKSADQGATWSDPIRISKFDGDCLDGDNTVEGAVPAVGPNGEIYVTWTGPKGLVMQRSLDGGKTWLAEEQQLHVQHGGWELKIPGMFRANGLPILVSDLSNGLNRGNLYLNWCDQKNGENDTDSWLSVSKDGGENWSEPVKVNQDASKRHQFFTWMTIDQTNGNLYFVYYDRRNYDDSRTDVYVSMSTDGGKTFHDAKINDTPFIPNEKVFFGDYLNIAAVNGVIRPIWPRMDEGKISLWVTLLTDELLLQNQPKR
ncbi:MAG: sialidase family protein [Flavobacteriia bacterium]|jgi:Neuraminidase (sialidase)